LDGTIGLLMHGGHPWRWTWPHDLSLSMAALAGESRGRRKGEREGERGDVAANRCGWVVSGTGAGMR
jgi:hypothetical protein